MNVQIGIIGPEKKNIPEDKIRMLDVAKEIGAELAKRGAILITGGCSGVSRAACEGAQSQRGITVGTPGRIRDTSASPVTVEICTPIDVGDYLFAGILSSDCIIAFPGDAGTVAELAIAYRYKKPIVVLKEYEDILQNLFGSFSKEYPLFTVGSAKEAACIAIEIAKQNFIKERKEE